MDDISGRDIKLDEDREGDAIALVHEKLDHVDAEANLVLLAR